MEPSRRDLGLGVVLHAVGVGALAPVVDRPAEVRIAQALGLVDSSSSSRSKAFSAQRCAEASSDAWSIVISPARKASSARGISRSARPTRTSRSTTRIGTRVVVATHAAVVLAPSSSKPRRASKPAVARAITASSRARWRCNSRWCRRRRAAKDRRRRPCRSRWPGPSSRTPAYEEGVTTTPGQTGAIRARPKKDSRRDAPDARAREPGIRRGPIRSLRVLRGYDAKNAQRTRSAPM